MAAEPETTAGSPAVRSLQPPAVSAAPAHKDRSTNADAAPQSLARFARAPVARVRAVDSLLSARRASPRLVSRLARLPLYQAAGRARAGASAAANIRGRWPGRAASRPTSSATRPSSDPAEPPVDRPTYLDRPVAARRSSRAHRARSDPRDCSFRRAAAARRTIGPARSLPHRHDFRLAQRPPTLLVPRYSSFFRTRVASVQPGPV